MKSENWGRTIKSPEVKDLHHVIAGLDVEITVVPDGLCSDMAFWAILQIFSLSANPKCLLINIVLSDIEKIIEIMLIRHISRTDKLFLFIVSARANTQEKENGRKAKLQW